MYTDKIDDLIDKTLDIFYNVVTKDSRFTKLLKEINFVKYQKDTNDMLLSYMETVNNNDIKEIIKDSYKIKTVTDVVKKYIMYYFFVYIGFFYKNKQDIFINNIVEFTQNQSKYKLSVPEFFNSSSNRKIVDLTILSKNILKIVNNPKDTVKDSDTVRAGEFLEFFGKEFVNATFKLESTNGKVTEQAHNIIKTVIISELYLNDDKQSLVQLLEDATVKKGKFIYIDIVVPLKEVVDLSTVEELLPPEKNVLGKAHDIYKMLVDYENLDNKDKDVDEKILELINSKIVVPVSEDFLLYHKDTEKYDAAYDPSKDRDSTKIKYITSKINTTTEYYSESAKKNKKLKDTIDKYFFTPLLNRKAVLINNAEDIRIINKIHNIGVKKQQLIELYNDLIDFRKYPYINFKDMSKDGFSIKLNKTVDVVRSTSFGKKDRKTLQMRVGSEEQIINIVGFMIPSKSVSTHCVTSSNVHMIQDVNFKNKNDNIKYPNGYTGTNRYIRHTLMKRDPKQHVLWMFDLNKDNVKVDSYEQIKDMSKDQQMKYIVSRLHNDTTDYIQSYIEEYMNKSNVSFYNFYNTVHKVRKNVLDISDSVVHSLEKLLYTEKYIHSKNEYDNNEDLFPGMYGDIVKLPVVSKKSTKVKDKKFSAPPVCQHNLTWDSIMAAKKKSISRFNDQLYNFVYKYVLENSEGDYVCKSCGVQVDIKTYVDDGNYDDAGNFVLHSKPVHSDLAEVYEYQKYKDSVRNIDKLLEKIADIHNTTNLSGTSISTKIKRHSLIKNVIDLLVAHNKLFDKMYKNRDTQLMYSLPQDISNLFVFDLEDSLYRYSSTDKDHYKPIKRNNILIYTVFIFILEQSEHSIISMKTNKTCNYYMFDKFGLNMFDNIRIKDSVGTTTPIQQYPLLCYIIYYISCMIVKYNMWYSSTTGKRTEKILLQKTVVVTLIDFINSVTEVYSKNKNSQIHNMVSVRFFRHLHNLFSTDHIIKKIADNEKNKIVTVNNQKKFITSKIKSVSLSGKYFPIYNRDTLYNGHHNFNRCRIAVNYIPKSKHIVQRLDNISNLTNCSTGEFHRWVPQGKIVVCSVCNVQLNKLKLDTELTNKIVKLYKKKLLDKVSNKYCSIGKLKPEVCKLDSKQIEIELEKIHDKKSIVETKIDDNNEVVDKLKSVYSKTKRHKEDYFNHINTFIKYVEDIIGKNININNENVFTDHDMYIINHDHNGFSIKNPIILHDKDNKIVFQKNNIFFKKDVVYYTNFKLNNMNVYYDAVTGLLLGYKEPNKEYSYSKVKGVYIKINYSVLNKLKFIGYPKKYMNIEQSKQKYFYKNKNNIIKKIVSDINRERILNLKKILVDVQRYIYKIKNTLKIETEDIIIKKYADKLSNIVTTNKDNEYSFLKDWEEVKNKLFFQELGDKDINIDPDATYISVDEASNYDYHGNVILFYIIKEFKKLIDYNPTKHIKISIVYFIFDMINQFHDSFNDEFKVNNLEIKRFNKIISSKAYIFDVQEKGHGIHDSQSEQLSGKTEGFYGDYVDEDDVVDSDEEERRDIDREEFEAIDVDGEIDYQIDYIDGVNS